MTSADAIIKLRELVGDARIAMITTRAPEGELHSRPLTLAEIDDTGTLLFFVDGAAHWVAGLDNGEPVNAALSDDKGKTWLSISGPASLSEDRATMHRLWSKPAEAFFPGGLDTPSLRLLRIEANSAEYWDAPASRVARLVIMAGALLGNRQTAMGDSGTIDLA